MVICEKCGQENALKVCLECQEEPSECRSCGKPVKQTGAGRKKYCDEKCRRVAFIKRRRENEIRRKANAPVRVCPYCNKPFQSTRRPRYCSDKCQLAWRDEYVRKIPPTLGKCLNCGEPFKGRADKKFCKQACGSAYRYKKQRKS